MDEATQTGAETSDLLQGQAADELAALMGTEEPEDEGADQDPVQQEGDGQSEDGTPEPEEERTYTLKVDGQDVVKTEKELIADAQKVLAANKRFEEAAAIRQQSDQTQAVVMQERAQLQQAIHAYADQLQQVLQAAEPNWAELLATDPTEYLRQQHIFNAQNQRLAQARNQERMLAEKNMQEEGQRKQKFLIDEQNKLFQAIPELAKPESESARKILTGMNTMLSDLGLNPKQVIDGIEDHRFWVILRDAAEYRALKTKQAPSLKQVSKLPPKIVKSGTGTPQANNGRTTALSRLEKTGKADDAQALIASLLK